MDIIDSCLHLQMYTIQSIWIGNKHHNEVRNLYINKRSNMYYRHQSNATYFQDETKWSQKNHNLFHITKYYKNHGATIGYIVGDYRVKLAIDIKKILPT